MLKIAKFYYYLYFVLIKTSLLNINSLDLSLTLLYLIVFYKIYTFLKLYYF